MQTPTEPNTFESHISPERLRILDVGCGDGARAAALKEAVPGRVVWGIEENPALAADARPLLDHVISAPIAKLTPLPVPAGFFDLAILDRVLGGLPNPEEFLLGLKSCLAPGAELLVREPNFCFWDTVRDLLSERLPALLLSRKRVFTRDALRMLTAAAGFRLEQEAYDGEPGQEAEPLAQAAEALGVDGDEARRAAGSKDLIARAAPVSPTFGPHSGELGAPSLEGVTAVIVTYNSARTLPACLAGVARALRSQDEIILVDNGSADETLGILRQFASRAERTTVIECGENLGYSAAANRGALASAGTFICFLNPDTVVLPGWSRRLAARLSDPSVGMVGPVSNYVSGLQFVGNYVQGGKVTLADMDQYLTQRFANQSCQSPVIIGMCAMLRRNTLDTIGLLDEDLFLGGDDLELSMRVKSHGLRMLVAIDVFLHHEGGASFGSLGADEKAKLLAESDAKLLSKIESHFGWRPPDTVLWGFDIMGK